MLVIISQSLSLAPWLAASCFFSNDGDQDQVDTTGEKAKVIGLRIDFEVRIGRT